jgi:hypothetical protein
MKHWQGKKLLNITTANQDSNDSKSAMHFSHECMLIWTSLLYFHTDLQLFLYSCITVAREMHFM